ncbi:MAG: dTDP-glucose 4,6-dehydratase [Candidatus Omnitrophica bacterium]|nr:dTDP-glucose 4,6-dehydratase [Candidatus Omnitrophota bacterium]
MQKSADFESRVSPRGASPRFLVTGGAGFIGSAFVRLLTKGLSPKGAVPVVVDKLTYAGDLKRLEEARGKFKFYKTDICSKKQIERVFFKDKPDIIVHFAAETHVDRSIQDSTPFIETNIKGTQVLLDASRKYNVKKFIFISTDEVYGEISKGKFSEKSAVRPNSPYAASKAAADLLTQAYIRTYKFPAIIIRPCNNYGPWQFPEKLIPVAIASVLKGGKAPVYARGQNVREWLYVDDCARGILQITQKGKIGEIYNLGSGIESKNIDTVRLILKYLGASQNRFEFVKDRPGHDLRYSLNSTKVRREIGWKPKISFKEGLRLTVNWYLKPWGRSLSKSGE